MRCGRIRSLTTALLSSSPFTDEQLSYIREWLGLNPPITKFDRIRIIHGSGSPEGVVTADPTAFYLDVDGGPGATFWVKESGVNTNTGWSSTTGLPVGAAEGAPLVFQGGSPTWGSANSLLPSGGSDGAPLTISTGAPVWGDTNQLVPTGGTAGQLVAVNASGNTSFVKRDVTGGISMPVDFSDGATHNVCGRTIPGGSLGPNGFIRVTIVARVITNAARTVSFSTFFTSGNITNSANTWVLRFEMLLVNNNSETSQIHTERLSLNLENTSTFATSSFADQLWAGTASNDTTADFTLTLPVGASSAITGSATVDLCLLEYGYVA